MVLCPFLVSLSYSRFRLSGYKRYCGTALIILEDRIFTYVNISPALRNCIAVSTSHFTDFTLLGEVEVLARSMGIALRH